MTISEGRRERMTARVDDLIDRVDQCLDAFDEASVFTGPSLFFHLEAIGRRRSLGSLRTAIEDRPLLVSTYATLASWGMHRMGPRGAKMVAFDAFAESIKAQQDKLLALEGLRLEQLNDEKAEQASKAIWDCLMSISVSATESRLVAGTKALHHLLPDLVPPMDRRYTDGFFFGADGTFNSLAFQDKPAVAFEAVLPQMARMARECEKSFAKRMNSGFHTSPTKCVDNAIVGYLLMKRGKAAAELLDE